MNGNYLKLIIGLTVGVILCGTLLVPVISSAQESTYETVEYTNDSLNSIHLSKIHAGESITVDSTGIVTPTGTIPYWSDTTYYNTILLTDTIGLWTNGASITGASFVESSASIVATTMTISVSAGEITYTADSGTPVTIPYTEGYIADLDGSHRSYFSGDTTPIYFAETSDLSGWRLSSGVLYILLDGNGTQDSIPFTNIHITSSEVPDTEGQIKQLSSISFGSKSINAYVVPNEVEYRFTDQQGLIALYSAIPIMIIVALVAMVAFTFRGRE